MKTYLFSAAVFCLVFSVGSLTPAGPLNDDKTRLCEQKLASAAPNASAQEILGLVDRLATENPAEFEELQKKFFGLTIDLSAKKELHKAIQQFVALADAKGRLPIKFETTKHRDAFADQLADTIDSELIARGLTPESAQKAWPSFENIYTRAKKILGRFLPMGTDEKTPSVNSYSFISALAQMTGSHTRKGNIVRPLIDGPDSISYVKRLIRSAKYEINIMSWAIKDDETGRELLADLIEAKKQRPNLIIRIIVDGQVAERPGYGSEVLKQMQANGMQVVLYRNKDPLTQYFGQHRKIVVIDGGVAGRTGGTNFGNNYSHKGNIADKDKWRDTDVAVLGPVASDLRNSFMKVFNEQVRQHGLNYPFMVFAAPQDPYDSGKDISLLIDHDPKSLKPDSVDPIYLAHLAAIRQAQTEIIISNAYVILIPGLREELQKAIQRGVKVVVLSNSAESIDEPVITIPTLKSMIELRDIGAEVYLRKGSTLHAKVMIVDQALTFVMSYNLHPRSVRLEGEVALLVWSQDLAAEMFKQFEIDISPANATRMAGDFTVPKTGSILNQLMKLLFNQI